MTAVKTHSGLVNLPDQPVFSCSLAVAFASFLDKQAQPLALQDMRQPLVAIGTGPGFDCRDRKGDTTIKLSEHGTANAADISAFTLANHTQVLVKDAASPTATDFAFLQNVRAAACVSFTTVLGPGANPAHAEHFHVDLAQRKGGYRICE